MMSQELYLMLNRTFASVRAAEREAVRLERMAEDERDTAQREVQALYDYLNGKQP